MSVLSWGAVMIWIEIAALIALQIQDGYRALKVFQQCHYHIDRYRDWIIERISLPLLSGGSRTICRFCCFCW